MAKAESSSQIADTLVVDAALAKLPPFPPMALQILDLAADPDVEIRRLVDVISSDAVFSVQILRFVNSPLFGHKVQIDSIQHALVALGLERVQSLVATVAVGHYVRAALKFDELRRCWRHTLACALLAQQLARGTSVPEDRAYTAGLLHDIGRLALLTAYPNEYAATLDSADREDVALLDRERKLFGADHCELGCCLADKWNFPQDFRIIAGRHHDTPSGFDVDLLRVVQAACELADMLGFQVAEPLRRPPYAEVRDLLPEPLRRNLPEDAGELKQRIEERLAAYDSAKGATMTAADAQEAPNLTVEPVPPAAEAGGESMQAGNGMKSPKLSDLAVFGIGCAVFTTILGLVLAIWRP